MMTFKDVTFGSIPPTKIALGVSFPTGSVYPLDNFSYGGLWFTTLGLLISCQWNNILLNVKGLYPGVSVQIQQYLTDLNHKSKVEEIVE